MTFYEPLGSNGTVITMVSGKAGREKTPSSLGNIHASFWQFGENYRFVAAFWRPLDFEWGSQNRQLFEEIEKMVSKKRVEKHMIFLLIFDDKMGGPKL